MPQSQSSSQPGTVWAVYGILHQTSFMVNIIFSDINSTMLAFLGGDCKQSQ